MDADGHWRGELQQLYISILASQEAQSIITLGKFNANFGLEGRDFWERTHGTTSLLFAAQPQDIVGLMLTQPLGDSHITLRPFAALDFQGQAEVNQSPAAGLVMEYKPIRNLKFSWTNWVGPGFVLEGGKPIRHPYPQGGYGTGDNDDDGAYGNVTAIENWQGPNLFANRGGTLYFTDANVSWQPRTDLSLGAEGLLGTSGTSLGRWGWSGAMLTADFNLTDRLSLFARTSFLHDSDWLIYGKFEDLCEYSTGARATKSPTKSKSAANIATITAQKAAASIPTLSTSPSAFDAVPRVCTQTRASQIRTSSRPPRHLPHRHHLLHHMRLPRQAMSPHYPPRSSSRPRNAIMHPIPPRPYPPPPSPRPGFHTTPVFDPVFSTVIRPPQRPHPRSYTAPSLFTYTRSVSAVNAPISPLLFLALLSSRPPCPHTPRPPVPAPSPSAHPSPRNTCASIPQTSSAPSPYSSHPIPSPIAAQTQPSRAAQNPPATARFDLASLFVLKIKITFPPSSRAASTCHSTVRTTPCNAQSHHPPDWRTTEKQSAPRPESDAPPHKSPSNS